MSRKLHVVARGYAFLEDRPLQQLFKLPNHPGHASFAPIEDFHWPWGSMTRNGGCRILLLHPSLGSTLGDSSVLVNSVNTVFLILDIRISDDTEFWKD
jgi:hypothetical protein